MLPSIFQKRLEEMQDHNASWPDPNGHWDQVYLDVYTDLATKPWCFQDANGNVYKSPPQIDTCREDWSNLYLKYANNSAALAILANIGMQPPTSLKQQTANAVQTTPVQTQPSPSSGTVTIPPVQVTGSTTPPTTPSSPSSSIPPPSPTAKYEPASNLWPILGLAALFTFAWYAPKRLKQGRVPNRRRPKRRKRR